MKNNNRFYRIALTLAFIICVSTYCHADKFLFQIMDITGADTTIVIDGIKMHRYDVISENQVWQWNGNADITVYVTPLDSEIGGTIKITSGEMKSKKANSLAYLNLTGKGVNNRNDVFVLSSNKKEVKLPIKTEKNVTYFIELNEKMVPLKIRDGNVYATYDLFKDKKKAITTWVFKREYESTNEYSDVPMDKYTFYINK